MDAKLLDTIKKLLQAIADLFKTMPPPNAQPVIFYSDKLYDAAYASIGKDVSPDDLAEDRFGCFESVSKIIQRVFPQLNFPTILSTKVGFDHFEKSPSWKPINYPEKGCVILNVTGTGNGKVANGHVGIVGKNLSEDGTLWIMSNNSETGTWEVSYSIESWQRYFDWKGGMPTHFYRRV